MPPSHRTARAAARSRRAPTPLLPLLLAGGLAGPSAAAPDWPAVAEEREIVAVTRDADGERRETTIWLLVQDGRGYIRTGSSTWGDNAVRDSEVVLRIRGEEHRLGIELVTDEARRDRITAGFREKYGLPDLLISPIRGSHPRIMRLVAR